MPSGFGLIESLDLFSNFFSEKSLAVRLSLGTLTLLAGKAINPDGLLAQRGECKMFARMTLGYLCFWSFLVTGSVSGQVFAASDLSGCFGYSSLSEDGEVSLDVTGSESVRWVGVDVPEAGYLHLGAKGGTAHGRPFVGLWGSGCLDSNNGSLRVLEREADHLVLWVREAQQVLFRITDEDPLVAPGLLTVHSRFKPSPLEALGAAGGEDEEEIEIDPGNLQEDPPTPPQQAGAGVGFDLSESCAWQIAEDDHGDSALCATPLSMGSIRGTLQGGGLHRRNRRDVDMFRFELPESEDGSWWQVDLRLSFPGGSAQEVMGNLIDDRGNRLGFQRSSREVSGFRFARALAPGTYFLRVEGTEGIEEDYGLELAASPW